VEKRQANPPCRMVGEWIKSGYHILKMKFFYHVLLELHMGIF